MVDSRFFTVAAPIDLQAILTLTGAVLATASGERVDPSRRFNNIASLDKAGKDDISFLDNIKYLDMFSKSMAGACFVRKKFIERAPSHMVLLVTDAPYSAFALATRHFYPEPAVEASISPHANIDATASIGRNVRIDAGASIGTRAVIGEGCWIGANAVIGAGVEIGSHSRIGPLSAISHTIMGQRVIIHQGVYIGQDGFGFAPTATGIIKVPQMGRVLIGNDVEIGAGSCIDRGAGPDTVIGDFSKIDNLVQIGHNVHIGKYVIIAAQCGISGSTTIGDGVMIGGQVGVAGHLHIGARAKIAAQSGVMHDVPSGESYGGAPALPVKDWHRQTVAIAKLGKKRELIDE